MYYVYVQNHDGTPLMPTRRFGKVRRMLKSGKAVVAKEKPFTIRLIYVPETDITQPVCLGKDPGRTNIGLSAIKEDGACLYSAHCETRNKEIPKLMARRKRHRQASRSGERLARKRLAKRLGTTAKKLLERILPGCEKPLAVKDIINTESRFNNRYREPGWLTPTARQLLQTHLNLVKQVQEILPVTHVSIEVNKFTFMDLEAGGKLKNYEAYRKGPMHGFADEKEALAAQQGGKCLLCRKRGIEHSHHLVQKSKGGSDTLANKAGLCKICHEKVHKDAKAAERLSKRKAGINKKYGALSVLNQIMPGLIVELAGMFGDHLFLTAGWKTKEYRDKYKIGKTHAADAYCIACAAFDVKAPKEPDGDYEIMQFRRQDRALIKSQTSRAYYLDDKKVAVNRRKAIVADPTTGEEKRQIQDSLEEWFAKQVKQFGQKEAEKIRSRLVARKGAKRYNRKDRLMPGAVFKYRGKRYVMSGQITNGQYLRAVGDAKTNYPANECRILRQNTGLVYL